MKDTVLRGAVPAAALLGSHIRSARLARGDSQATLAQRAGISEVTLRRIERGESGAAIGHVLAVLEAMGLVRQLVESVSPAQDALAPSRLPKRAGRRRPSRDWGEDLF